MLDVNSLLGFQPKTPQTTQIVAVTSAGYGSVGTKIRRFTSVQSKQGSGVIYTDDALLGGSFTVVEPGTYSMYYQDDFTGSAQMGFSLNSTELSTNLTSIAATTRLCAIFSGAANQLSSVSTTRYLPAGSIIRVHTEGANAGAANLAQVTIVKVSA